jgi:large subunit ribosomal protein L24
MKAEKMQNKRIRKGDKVMIICGNDRGLVGEVLSRTTDRITVRGVNVRKKHVKRSQANPNGGIVEMERAIHISNVTHCVDEEKPRKVKVAFDKKGRRLLVYKEGDTDVPFRPIKEPKK